MAPIRFGRLMLPVAALMVALVCGLRFGSTGKPWRGLHPGI